jgi:hypothetical protein
MLSVVIATENSERVLVPTLAALVAGSANGLVREVILADRGSSDGTAMIADEAGCRIEVAAGSVGERLRSAATKARGAWLLFLRPGVFLDASWTEEVTGFMQRAELGGYADARAATFRPGAEADTPLATLSEALRMIAAAIGARPHPHQGLLISRSLYDKVGGHRAEALDAEARLLRDLGRTRIVMLRSRALVMAAV